MGHSRRVRLTRIGLLLCKQETVHEGKSFKALNCINVLKKKSGVELVFRGRMKNEKDRFQPTISIQQQDNAPWFKGEAKVADKQAKIGTGDAQQDAWHERINQNITTLGVQAGIQGELFDQGSRLVDEVNTRIGHPKEEIQGLDRRLRKVGK